MKILLITFVLLEALACNNIGKRQDPAPTAENKEPARVAENSRTELPADWKLISACSLQFYVPRDFKEEKTQGIDSCVKTYAGKNIQLSIDKVLVGIDLPNYSRSNEYSTKSDYSLEKTSVDGKRAEIITFSVGETASNRSDLIYIAIFDIPEAGLTMLADCKSVEGRKSAINIFKSVKFVGNER